MMCSACNKTIEQPAPVQTETVSVFGVKPNGEMVDTGVKAPMPPRMKAKELVRETFGAWADDDGSEADFCFAVCEQFFDWLIAQGWAAQPRKAVKLSDSEIFGMWAGTANMVPHCKHHKHFARAIEQAVWEKLGVTE